MNRYCFLRNVVRSRIPIDEVDWIRPHIDFEIPSLSKEERLSIQADHMDHIEEVLERLLIWPDPVFKEVIQIMRDEEDKQFLELVA